MPPSSKRMWNLYYVEHNYCAFLFSSLCQMNYCGGLDKEGKRLDRLERSISYVQTLFLNLMNDQVFYLPNAFSVGTGCFFLSPCSWRAIKQWKFSIAKHCNYADVGDLAVKVVVKPIGSHTDISGSPACVPMDFSLNLKPDLDLSFEQKIVLGWSL